MQRKGAFDYILLETTGLADPGMFPILGLNVALNCMSFEGPIASIFWRNEEFNRGGGKDIVLDGIVCVVDAVFGKQVGTLAECRMYFIHILAANGDRPRSGGYWRESEVSFSLGHVSFAWSNSKIGKSRLRMSFC
jgi:hypothetical protein